MLPYSKLPLPSCQWRSCQRSYLKKQDPIAFARVCWGVLCLYRVSPPLGVTANLGGGCLLMTLGGRHKVVSEASVPRSIQAEKTKAPLRADCWLPMGHVYVILLAERPSKARSKCMLSLGIAVAKSRMGTKKLEWKRQSHHFS